jgi:hypothetical protein
MTEREKAEKEIGETQKYFGFALLILVFNCIFFGVLGLNEANFGLMFFWIEIMIFTGYCAVSLYWHEAYDFIRYCSATLHKRKAHNEGSNRA